MCKSYTIRGDAVYSEKTKGPMPSPKTPSRRRAKGKGCPGCDREGRRRVAQDIVAARESVRGQRPAHARPAAAQSGRLRRGQAVRAQEAARQAVATSASYFAEGKQSIVQEGVRAQILAQTNSQRVISDACSWTLFAPATRRGCTTSRRCTAPWTACPTAPTSTRSIIECIASEEAKAEHSASDSDELYAECAPTPASPPLPPSPNDAEHDEKREWFTFGKQALSYAATLVPDSDYAAPIPDILRALRKALFCGKRARGVEAAFRCEADAAALRKARQRLRQSALDEVDLGGLDGAVQVALLKLWFSSLPVSVLSGLSAARMARCKDMQMAGDVVERELDELNKTYLTPTRTAMAWWTPTRRRRSSRAQRARRRCLSRLASQG